MMRDWRRVPDTPGLPTSHQWPPDRGPALAAAIPNTQIIIHFVRNCNFIKSGNKRKFRFLNNKFVNSDGQRLLSFYKIVS